MQIQPNSVTLVRLNVGLSLYLDRTFRLRLLLSVFRLSEITSLFDLSLVLDRTLAQWKAQQKG